MKTFQYEPRDLDRCSGCGVWTISGTCHHCLPPEEVAA